MKKVLSISYVLLLVGTCCVPTSLFFKAPSEKRGTRGNWLKKREWYKQAKAVHLDIEQDVTDALKQKGVFYDLLGAADKKIDAFYCENGFSRGQLEGMHQDLKKDLKEEKQKRLRVAKERAGQEGMPRNFYEVQVDAIEDESKRFARELEQFKLDITSISELDDSLKQRLKVVDEQAKSVREIGEKAQKITEEIVHIFDDKQARLSYYELKDIAAHVASIREYLQVTLLQDFKKVIAHIESQIAIVTKQITSLERRGLIIEHRIERLEKINKEMRIKKAFERLEEEAPPKKRKRRRKKRVALKWWQHILSPFKRFFSFVVHSFGAV